MVETDSDDQVDDLENLLQAPKAGAAREVPPMQKKRHKHKLHDLSPDSHKFGRWALLLYFLGGQAQVYSYRYL